MAQGLGHWVCAVGFGLREQSIMRAHRGGQGAGDFMISSEMLFFSKRFYFESLLGFMFP